jgi:uncharacterized protein YajQ (UPF0234 family)
MADQYSFDITTGCDVQEVDNAVNQALKEISQRFDFKTVKFTLEFLKAEKKIVVVAPDEYRLDAIWDVLQSKLVKRQVPLQNVVLGKPVGSAGSAVRREATLQQGIPGDKAKDIVKYIKDEKIKKVQASIQGEQVRVASPSKDALQEAMNLLRQKDFGVQLHFGNYR